MAAAEVARLVAKLEADVRDFDRDMKKAEKRLGSLEKKTKQSNQAMKKSQGAMSGISSAAKKMGLAIGAAFATKAVIDFTKQTIAAASDLEESINAVEVTFGKASAGILQLGEDAATAVGLSNNEFNSLAVGFSAFVEKIAGDGGDVVDTMSDLTTRVADFASVMNLEVAEAGNIFRSALAGETEAIRRFGVDVSAAAVNAKAMALGLADSSAELTEQDKILSRYQLVMEQTQKTAGDFANTSDSLANQQRIFNSELENMKAEIGEALLPVMAQLVETAREMLPAFKQFAEGLTETLAGIVPLLQGLGWLVGKFGEVSSAAEQAATEMRNPLSAMGAFLAEAFTVGAPVLFFRALKRGKSVIDGTIQANRKLAKSLRLIGEAAGNNKEQTQAYSDGIKEIAEAGDLTKERLDELADAVEFADGQMQRLLLTNLRWAESTGQSGQTVLALRQALTELVRSTTDSEQAAINLAKALGFVLTPMDDIIGRTQDIRDAVLDGRDAILNMPPPDSGVASGFLDIKTEAELAAEQIQFVQDKLRALTDPVFAATEAARAAAESERALEAARAKGPADSPKVLKAAEEHLQNVQDLAFAADNLETVMGVGLVKSLREWGKAAKIPQSIMDALLATTFELDGWEGVSEDIFHLSEESQRNLDHFLEINEIDLKVITAEIDYEERNEAALERFLEVNDTSATAILNYQERNAASLARFLAVNTNDSFAPPPTAPNPGFKPGDFSGFATGGTVPGPVGKPMLAVVHGGEEVRTPAQQLDAGGTQIGPFHIGELTEAALDETIEDLLGASLTLNAETR